MTRFTVGDRREAVVVENLTRTQIVQYAGASGDYSPLHTDEIYARCVAGYPTVVGHGMLTMALTGRLVTDWVGQDNVTRFGLRFMSPVWPGDTLTARATVDAVTDGGTCIELVLSTVNQEGLEVASGYATVRLEAFAAAFKG
jgi:acyl dehydratase